MAKKAAKTSETVEGVKAGLELKGQELADEQAADEAKLRSLEAARGEPEEERTPLNDDAPPEESPEEAPPEEDVDQPAGQAAASGPKGAPAAPKPTSKPVDDTGDLKTAIQAKNRELAELKQLNKVWEDRFNIILQRALPQPKVEQPKVPTFEEDPVAHLQSREQAFEQLKQEVAQRDMIRQVEHLQTTTDFMGSRAFPDWEDATLYLKSAYREAQIEAGATEEEADRITYAETVKILANAARSGRKPHEVIYNVAKRWGYKGPEAAPANGAPANGNGKPSTQAASKVAAIKSGTQAAKTLGGGGGSPPPTGVPSAKELSRMKDADFDKFLLEHPELFKAAAEQAQGGR